MTGERSEKVEVQKQGDTARKKRVVERNPSTQNVIVSRLKQFAWLVTGVITGFIALRFVLRLLAANPDNVFADFVYDVSAYFVAPFQTLLANPGAADGGAVMEITSLIAIIAYVLLGAVITMLLDLFRDSGGSRNVKIIQQN
jgi:uncharacterized protein YggT (Ycf19 family)